jgi:hypothetical protein
VVDFSTIAQEVVISVTEVWASVTYVHLARYHAVDHTLEPYDANRYEAHGDKVDAASPLSGLLRLADDFL